MCLYQARPQYMLHTIRICAIQPAYSQHGLHRQHDLHNIFCNLTCIFCKQTCMSIAIAKLALQFFALDFLCELVVFLCGLWATPAGPAGQ